MKTIIEQYIQFAIDNGYKFHNFIKIFEIVFLDNFGNINIRNNKFQYDTNLYMLITSKPFIEAIAKGLCKDMSIENANQFFFGTTPVDDRGNEIPHKYSNRTRKETEEMFKKITGKQMSKMELSDRDIILNAIREGLLHIDKITTEQAFAIRDNALEEFIIDLGIGKKNQ